MDSKKYQRLTGSTDLDDYSGISKRITQNQDECISIMKEILTLSIKGDMLKKVIIYGLDPNSDDYKSKLQKQIDALNVIESGEISDEVIKSDKFARLFHAYLGLNTESGETIGALLSWLTNGQKLDEVNLGEENGDCLWYLARSNETLGTSFGAQMLTNIKKLAARYPEKFSGEKALNRDLSREREILNKNLKTGFLNKIFNWGK